MYRQRGVPRPLRVVEYGRFPVRRGRAAFALLAIVLGVVLLLTVSSPKELVCDRGGAECTITRNTLVGGRWLRFTPSWVTEVRTGTRTGKGNRITAHTVVLLDMRGAETSFAWSDEAKAKRAFVAAEQF